jgi:hypothetical protein
LSIAFSKFPGEEGKISAPGQMHRLNAAPLVILSERSESKDLRMLGTAAVKSVRRSFDSGLRPPLRMTSVWVLSKSTIFPVGFSRFYHEIFVDFLTICDTMRKSANADNSLLTTRLWAIKTIRRCKQHG